MFSYYLVEMAKKGVFVGLLVLCTFLLVSVPSVDGYYSSETLSWSNGLRISVVCENLDYWVTGTVFSIHLTLTLLATGTVIEFESITCAVYLVTEEVDVSIGVLNSPWSNPGDKVKVTVEFTVTPEQINSTGWDMYLAQFYYQINQSNRVDGGSRINHHTDLRGPRMLNISTVQFAILWPFPPIILMMFVYWGLFAGLRRFNRRYEGLEETTSIQSVEMKPPPDTSHEY